MYTTLSSKGQVTIPAEIRNRLRLNVGDRIEFVIFESNRVEMIPQRGSVGALKGMVKWARRPVSLAEMDEAIAMEAGK
jgi:AbrB family looped-hinge helix DNA binding protein